MHLQQGDDTIFQDAAATFRSLKLGDTQPAEGEAANDDSSSSSSSTDDADVTLRMPPSVVMQVRVAMRRTPLEYTAICKDAGLMRSVARPTVNHPSPLMPHQPMSILG